MFFPLACLVSASVFFSPFAFGQSSANPGSVRRSAHKVIDEKAAVATPGDEQSISDLADAVLSFPRLYPRMDPDVEAYVKTRLVHAEVAYREGRHAGIQESDIVSFVNELAKTFNLPSYAKTSVSQIRSLRMRLAIAEPQFIGPNLTKHSKAVGDSVSSEVSPLQALHLIETLANLKLLNPEFQVPPEEWDAKAGMPIRAPSQNPSNAGQTPTYQLTVSANPHTRELYDAFRNGFSSLNSFQAAQLLEQAFRKLNIP